MGGILPWPKRLSLGQFLAAYTMKFPFRDLLLVTVIVALAGCKGSNSQDDDDIQYYEPGPEFRHSREAEKDGDLLNSPAPDQNLPTE